MLFADDLVICDERERMEERLENWRGCLEDAGLKVSSSKTTGSTDLSQVATFNYLGTTIDYEGRWVT